MDTLVCLALWIGSLMAAGTRVSHDVAVARTWVPSAQPPAGYFLVAQDDCGAEGRQPHIVRGRRIVTKGKATHPFLRTAVTADTFWRSIVYRCRGLDAKAAYRLRLAFPPTYGQRALLSVNGHFLGEPKLHHKIPAPKVFVIPQEEAPFLEFDIPGAWLSDGDLELRLQNRAGWLAQVCLIELWADRPVKLDTEPRRPGMPNCGRLADSAWKPLRWEGRPFFFRPYSRLSQHRDGGPYARFRREVELHHMLTPLWNDLSFRLMEPEHTGGVWEWGWWLQIDGDTKVDCYEYTRRWFTAQRERVKAEGKIFGSMNGHAWFEPYAAQWGADFITTEWGAGSPCAQARLALVRGAARQNRVPFAIHNSPWYGGGLIFYEAGQDESVPRKGHSASYLNRAWHIIWLSGAAFTIPEAAQASFFHRLPEQKGKPWQFRSVHNDIPEDVRLEVSPVGRNAMAFVRLIEKHPDVGIPYTPFALVLDEYAGFNITPHPPTLQPWWRLSPSPADRAAQLFLDTFFSGTCIFARGEKATESRLMVNHPHGETADILLSNVSNDVLDLYPVAILLGDHALTPPTRKTLLAYLKQGGHLIMSPRLAAQLGADLSAFRTAGHFELANTEEDRKPIQELLRHLTATYLPVEVGGDIQYTLNRTKDGWLVGLVNNRGVAKDFFGPVIVDPGKEQTVSVGLKRGTIRTAREWVTGQMIEVDENATRPTIPPGAVRVLELVCQRPRD